MVWIVNGKYGKYIPKDEIEDYKSNGIEIQPIHNHKLNKMEYFAVLGNIEDINKYLNRKVFKK